MVESIAAIARSMSSTPPSSISYTFQLSETSLDAQQTEPDHATKHDRFAHTRTKRKRTSPEDFAILEAEYQINAKPNRGTRNSLANRVTLNEREIQVWFQNRRQMTRRKRHTWQPNEITSIIRSSQDLAKSMDSSHTTPNSSFDGTPPADEPQHGLDSSQVSQTSTVGKEEDQTNVTKQVVENTESQDLEHSEETLVDSQLDLALSSKESTQTKTLPAEAFTPRKLKRTSSTVRLAMSLDGKASVILRGQTPSPPNKPTHTDPLKRGILQRSQSLVSTLATASTQADASPLLTTISRQPGRSRDTRNWEFWCDSERRESLTKSAEIDLRGSAAGPLSLLRSTSSKQNSNPAPKKRKSEEALVSDRPKLSRTKSSHARLQSTDNYGKKEDLKKKSNLIYVDDNDSDKENVDPEGSLTAPRRRTVTPKPPGSKRRILQENTNMLSHSTSLGALLAKEKQTTSAKVLNKRNTKIAASLDKENVDIDPEVSNFMNPSSESRGAEDMDAVQNLLRLSQGAWR